MYKYLVIFMYFYIYLFIIIYLFLKDVTMENIIFFVKIKLLPWETIKKSKYVFQDFLK